MQHVLVDPGSSSEVMYKNLYDKLKLPRNKIRLVDMPIFSFTEQLVWSVGTIQVSVRVGPVLVEVEFFIVDIDAPYNVILIRS